MARTLSDDFAELQTRYLVHDGVEIWSMLEFEAPSGTSLSVRRLSESASRVEGIRLQAVGGELIAEGIRSSAIVVWTDTAPELVTIEFAAKAKKSGTVRLWNVWRDDQGGEHAWIGNSGMTVGRHESGYDVRCSDGWGEVEFTDLHLRLLAPDWQFVPAARRGDV